jgi:23S rRNA-/tRNA-specific pseudouridylate synthase
MTLRTRWRPHDNFLVLYKDADIVVVDKKAGILTVGRPSGRGADLLHKLQELLGPRSRVFAVHRLDRPVSGVLVFARHAGAEQGLRAQFAAHDVERRYLAAVQGLVKEEEGTFPSVLRVSGSW